MKKAIIHIGPHKTGTTYLQASLHFHRDALRARGFILPEGWNHSAHDASQTGLVAAIGPEGDLDRAAAVLARASAQGGHTLLISAEDLVSQKPDALLRLRTLLGDMEVRIVFYVRRWSELLPSGWQESIKHGSSMSFPEYVAINVRNPSTSPLLNLDMRIAHFAGIFGIESLRLPSYSALRDNDVDMFTHFAKTFLDWPDAAPRPGPREVNSSRGPLDIELLRALNAIAIDRTGTRSALLRRKLDSLQPALDLEHLFASMEKSQTSFRFSDAFVHLHALHGELFAKYSAQVVRPALKDLFYRPKAVDLPFIHSDYLLRPGIVDRLTAIYERIQALPD